MFRIDIETCQVRGSAVKVVASIEEPVVFEKILIHVRRTELQREPSWRLEPRASSGG